MSGYSFARRSVLSTTLKDLCVAKLAEFADYIREFGPVPDELIRDILGRSSIKGASLRKIEQVQLCSRFVARWGALC